MGLEMDAIVDYYAVGFADEGNYGMKNFDIVTFIFVPNNDTYNTYTVSVLDLYSNKNARPPEDSTIGGTADYKIIDYYVADGKSQVLFSRALDTGDQYDYTFDPINTERSIVMNWAWANKGKHRMTYHKENCGCVISTMYNGFQGVAKPYDGGGLPSHLVLTIHGWMMLIGWGVLIEIAIQFGRYRKFDKRYIAVHVWINIILYILTVLSSSLTLYISNITNTTQLTFDNRLG